jgi:chromosome segregation ATPase
MMQEHPPDGTNTSVVAPASSAHATGSEPDEVLRLERLLVASSRNRRALAHEIDRRSALLREVLERIGELEHDLAPTAAPEPSPASRSASADPCVELRAELDDARAERSAAVARALEAEAARAETAFRLDEALGHLSAGRGKAPGADPSALEGAALEQAELLGTARGLRARLAEAEEALGVAEARVVLAEQDLAEARARARGLERELNEAQERFELELLHARGDRDTQEAHAADLFTTLAGAQGECSGGSARADEAERAFVHARTRAQRAERSLQDAIEKLEGLRAESAEVVLAAHSRASRIAELTADLSAERDAARELRAELAHKEAVHDALQAALASRDEHVDQLAAKLHDLQSAQAEAQTGLAVVSAAASLGDRRATVMRKALSDVRAPLQDLSSALHGIVLGARESSGGGVGDSPQMTEEPTVPGLPILLEAPAGWEQQQVAAQARIDELQAQLAGRIRMSMRDTGLSALKGELIDVRASAARLADDLAKERSRRRKFAVTVRAMQAAAESGESPVPWIDELVSLLNDGATLPPPPAAT